MKKSLLAIIILTLSLSGFSQCKVEKDAFTNEKVVSYNYHNKVIYFDYRADSILFEIMFDYDGAIKVLIPAGTELMFKLENGEIIKLLTIIDSAPMSKVESNSIRTKYSYRMILTRDEIKKMANSYVTLIRYPDTKGGFTDAKLTGLAKKFAKAIYKGAKCIYENI